MANAHYGLHFEVVTRGKGGSVVNAAAYQSGERLKDMRTGKVYDFASKNLADNNVVLENRIILPTGADERFLDRSTLYNHIEETHTAKNSQLARWGRVNIPREIPEAERMELVATFVKKEFVDRGMIADIALQECPAGDGQPNPHAHILLAMRPLEEDGKNLPKRAGAGRHWNDLFTKGVNAENLGFANSKGEGDGFVKNSAGLVAFRELWATHVNEWLESSGSEERCSHLSYKARGIAKEAQPYIGKAKYVKPEERHLSKAHNAVADVIDNNEVRRYFNPQTYQRRRAAAGVAASRNMTQEEFLAFYDSDNNREVTELQGRGSYER